MQKKIFLTVISLGLLIIAADYFLRVPARDDRFTRLMTVGKGYLEKGEATNAILSYREAVAIAPDDLDPRLNLANALLLAGDNQPALEAARQALELDHNSAAAHYLIGLAHLRLNQLEAAVKAFQQSQKIDPAITALNFQLGIAQERLGHAEDAAQEFETVVQFDPEHLAAHYRLSQLYLRAGRAADAATEAQKHQEILAKHPNPPTDPTVFERCQYTEARMAFVLEQPDRLGVPVRFVNTTATAFAQASAYHGPLAVLDLNHDGRNSLFVTEGDKGFRVLNNVKGVFQPLGEALPGKAGATYRTCLTGDLNNDRVEDVLVLGEQASFAFRFATNGIARDVTAACGFTDLKAGDGVLADLDFTGKLDLLATAPAGQGLRVYRNLGNFYFQLQTTNSGLSADLGGIAAVAMEDWNDDDLPGVMIARTNQPVVFHPKQRAGPFVSPATNAPWPSGTCLVSGDLDNDLRADLVVAGEKDLRIVYGRHNLQTNIPLAGFQVRSLLLVDYDNDGWLDIIATGSGVRVWRNLGQAGFADMTVALGLDKVGPVDALVAADFDNDGATDFIVSTAGGLQCWRNEGGAANQQLKLRLQGNRSNSSALGVRVELTAGNWHAIRSVQHLPVEIGVGRHPKLDTLKARWFDLATTAVDVPVGARPLEFVELMVPTGSCPYLYAWDGHGYRFVTDMLGASPLGLPLNGSRYIEADPIEYLALGNESAFPPRDGAYQIRLTEELREVLYLDQAKLVVLDHPAGTVVHPTSKLHPGKPFPPHELWTLRPLASLQHATRGDGREVTRELAHIDGQMVSPIHLREPQLRGLAEPYSITLDFGTLPVDRPLVLALTGWLRFGGGMANVAAGLDSQLPFPFPTLEAELPDGKWLAVPVDVGAPAGKTKTILVDLDKKLPAGARRLRLTMAFEIHWDAAELLERTADAQNRRADFASGTADLRWRGFSEFAELPESLPLTPVYDRVKATPPWRITPEGWCTRYGPVSELCRDQDEKLVLINGGDELALSFPADRLPAKPAGFVRDFFLYVVGWDKDADFHVGQGWRVEPLPFTGMDDQAYGRQPRPVGLADDWIVKYNTRWVGQRILSRVGAAGGGPKLAE